MRGMRGMRGLRGLREFHLLKKSWVRGKYNRRWVRYLPAVTISA